MSSRLPDHSVHVMQVHAKPGGGVEFHTWTVGPDDPEPAAAASAPTAAAAANEPPSDPASDEKGKGEEKGKGKEVKKEEETEDTNSQQDQKNATAQGKTKRSAWEGRAARAFWGDDRSPLRERVAPVPSSVPQSKTAQASGSGPQVKAVRVFRPVAQEEGVKVPGAELHINATQAAGSGPQGITHASEPVLQTIAIQAAGAGLPGVTQTSAPVPQTNAVQAAGSASQVRAGEEASNPSKSPPQVRAVRVLRYVPRARSIRALRLGTSTRPRAISLFRAGSPVPGELLSRLEGVQEVAREVREKGKHVARREDDLPASGPTVATWAMREAAARGMFARRQHAHSRFGVDIGASSATSSGDNAAEPPALRATFLPTTSSSISHSRTTTNSHRNTANSHHNNTSNSRVRHRRPRPGYRKMATPVTPRAAVPSLATSGSATPVAAARSGSATPVARNLAAREREARELLEQMKINDTNLLELASTQKASYADIVKDTGLPNAKGPWIQKGGYDQSAPYDPNRNWQMFQEAGEKNLKGAFAKNRKAVHAMTSLKHIPMDGPTTDPWDHKVDGYSDNMELEDLNNNLEPVGFMPYREISAEELRDALDVEKEERLAKLVLSPRLLRHKEEQERIKGFEDSDDSTFAPNVDKPPPPTAKFPPVQKGQGSALYKGKGKSVDDSMSQQQIRTHIYPHAGHPSNPYSTPGSNPYLPPPYAQATNVYDQLVGTVGPHGGMQYRSSGHTFSMEHAAANNTFVPQSFLDLVRNPVRVANEGAGFYDSAYVEALKHRNSPKPEDAKGDKEGTETPGGGRDDNPGGNFSMGSFAERGNNAREYVSMVGNDLSDLSTFGHFNTQHPEHPRYSFGRQDFGQVGRGHVDMNRDYGHVGREFGPMGGNMGSQMGGNMGGHMGGSMMGGGFVPQDQPGAYGGSGFGPLPGMNPGFGQHSYAGSGNMGSGPNFGGHPGFGSNSGFGGNAMMMGPSGNSSMMGSPQMQRGGPAYPRGQNFQSAAEHGESSWLGMGPGPDHSLGARDVQHPPYGPPPMGNHGFGSQPGYNANANRNANPNPQRQGPSRRRRAVPIVNPTSRMGGESGFNADFDGNMRGAFGNL